LSPRGEVNSWAQRGAELPSSHRASRRTRISWRDCSTCCVMSCQRRKATRVDGKRHGRKWIRLRGIAWRASRIHRHVLVFGQRQQCRHMPHRGVVLQRGEATAPAQVSDRQPQSWEASAAETAGFAQARLDCPRGTHAAEAGAKMVSSASVYRAPVSLVYSLSASAGSARELAI